MNAPPRGMAWLLLIGLVLLSDLEALLPSMPRPPGRVKGTRRQLSGHCRGRHYSELAISSTMAPVGVGSEDMNVQLKFKKEDCKNKRTEAFIIAQKMSSSDGNEPPKSSSYLTYPGNFPP